MLYFLRPPSPEVVPKKKKKKKKINDEHARMPTETDRDSFSSAYCCNGELKISCYLRSSSLCADISLLQVNTNHKIF